jgi:hypothetical protein
VIILPRKVTEKTRVAQHRGKGHGAEYKPWILPSELKSLSTTTSYYDRKVGRQIALLSQGEKMVYLILQWRDDVKEIREQFPLNIEETQKIAKYYDILHPCSAGNLVHMTSDFLVDFVDDTQKVYSVKSNINELKNKRTVEKLFIEKTYWNYHGIEYVMVFKDSDINQTYATNIRDVMAYYDFEDVHSVEDLVMNLIAHKNIVTDMTVRQLPIKQLAKNYWKFLNAYLSDYNEKTVGENMNEAVEIRERIHIATQNKQLHWRVLYTNAQHTVLCQMEIKKLVIKTVSTESLLTSMWTGYIVTIDDENKLSPKIKERFHIYQTIVKKLNDEFGPTYSDIAGKKNGEFINNLIREIGVSRATIWKVIRLYLQSGMREYSLIDGRYYGKMPDTIHYKTKAGRPCKSNKKK